MPTYTAEQIEAAGGRRWTNPRTGAVRVYLNDWAPLVGLEVEHYKTGNIQSARLGGEQISNTRAAKLGGVKMWWEEDGHIHSNLRAVADNARLDGDALCRRLHDNLTARTAGAGS